MKKNEGEDFKKNFKKFWYLLWSDNSFKGWIFSIVFLFVFIKFIFLPSLSFVTGTSMPLAIVESCSMYHEGNVFSNLGNWFERHEGKYSEFDITEEQFKKFDMNGGFSKGDILFIIGADPNKLKIGDVILFSSGIGGTPIIHRLIKIEEIEGEKIFTTIGDNNNGMLTPQNNLGGIDETEIREDQLIGKTIFRLTPWFGWAKLIFFEGMRTESERGFCHEN